MMRIVVILAFLMASVGADAQSRQRTWCLTPRVGVNSSDMTGLKWYETLGDGTNHVAGDMETTRKWGFTAGFDVEGLLHPRFGLSVGVYYSDEGYVFDPFQEGTPVYDSSGNQMTASEYVHLHMISVPVLAQFYVLPGLALKSGVQLSGLTNAQDHYKGNKTNILNNTKTFHVSIPVGVSYDYKNVSFDVRYLFGLTNFCDNRAMTDLDAKWRSNSLWMTLGYRIDLYKWKEKKQFSISK